MEPPLLGYPRTNAGLNNQKIGLFGLISIAARQGTNIAVPLIDDFDPATSRVVGQRKWSDVFDVQPLRDFSALHGVSLEDDRHTETIGFHDAFKVGSQEIRDAAIDHKSAAAQYLRATRPNSKMQGVFDLYSAQASNRCINLVCQLRIEPDWKLHVAQKLPLDPHEDNTPSFQMILRKIYNKFKSEINAILFCCDEVALGEAKEEVREFCLREYGYKVFMKGDLLENSLRLSLSERTLVDFDLAVRAPIFIGTSKSTFANLVSLTRVSANCGGSYAHYIYNGVAAEVERRIDNGAFYSPHRAVKEVWKGV